MATTVSWRAGEPATVGIRHVAALAPIDWLRRGWDDLLHSHGTSLAHGALIAVLGAVLLALGSTHPYFVAAAVSGYLLVGPIMTMGICELSRRRASGEPVGFDESLQPLGREMAALMQFGAILVTIAVLWFLASEAMLRTVLDVSAPSLAQVVWGGFADATSRTQVFAYLGAGAVLAVIVFTLSVIAVPLIIERRATATEAMAASARAVLANLPAMLVWSVLIVAMTALAFATLLIGMIIVAPLLGHATWHAYRDLTA